MNCDECREAVVREGAAEGQAAEHAASCPACAAWAQREAAVMGRLGESGASWRRRPMGAEVVGRLPARVPAPRFRVARWMAAAAALALAAGGVIVASRPTPANAMVVMMRQLRQQGNLRFSLEVPGHPRESGLYSISGSRLRLESEAGFTHVMNADLHRGAVLWPERHELVRGGRPDGMLDFYGLFMALGDAPRVEEIGRAELGGREAEVFRVQVPPVLDALRDATATVWLDVATRLPLRVEIPTALSGGSAGLVIFRDFAFDQPMGEELFDTNPSGYTERPPEATTPAIGHEMAVKLRNVGMAFHMSMQEHDGAVPDSLESLAAYLEPDGLRSLRRPGEAIGYVYVKPTLPLQYDHVLAYERFAEQSEHVWVLMVDSSVQLKTQAELAELLRAAGR